MNLYILDTDHLSLFQRRHPKVVSRILAMPLSQRAITIITVEEQLRGRLSQIKEARTTQAYINACAALHEAIRFFAGIRILDFGEEANIHFETLKAAKIHVGNRDLRIASFAVSTQNVLVTRNRSDFEKVHGLLIEDWSI